ncbi:SGNH/GDSL hydrolase family protein [Myroides odoratus]|uniref:SGNH/GDSL hydrolase family protein n=1 Tax=Myroides odoratus TaxID=256 RepID=UPI00334078CA
MSDTPKLATEDQVKSVADTFTELYNHQGKQIKSIESGIIDTILPSSPAPTKRGQYVVSAVGVYINFKDSNNQAISVTEEEFTSGIVYLIYNGTNSRKVVVPIEANGEIINNDIRPVSGSKVYTQNYVNETKLKKSSSSRNKFDKTAIQKGFMIDYNTGNILATTSSGRNISAYMRVSKDAFFTASGLSTNPLNNRVSIFENIGDTIAYEKMPLPTFKAPIDGYVVIDVTDSYLNSLQLEEGKASTPYVDYAPVIEGIYDFNIQSEFASKVLKEPKLPDDIASFASLDNITAYNVYTDVEELFNLSSPEFSNVYSSDSSIGYIRTLSRGTLFNFLSFYLGKNEYTAPIIDVTIGTVEKVGAFSVDKINVLGNFQIDASLIPENPILLNFNIETPITVQKDINLVVLFNTPTKIPVFKNTMAGYSILYKTVAAPTTWSYGYRKSSGIILGYRNKQTTKFVKEIAKEEIAVDPFKGKRIVTAGDSITYHAGSWARLLFEQYGKDFLNIAVSGARFQDYPDTEIDFTGTWNNNNNTAFNQLLRLAQAITPIGEQIVLNNPFRNELYAVPISDGVGTGAFSQPDIIIVAMATNDSALEVPNAIINYINTPLDQLNRAENMVTGMRWFIEYLIALCPKAQIIYSTPIQANPTSSRKYSITKVKRDRALEVCNYYGIPVIDSFNESGISEKFEIASSPGKYLSDGLHPNDMGKQLMANFLGNRIKNLL